jgi:hypothetical protein
MGAYRIIAGQRSAVDGLDYIIGGPGIPPSGIRYWFASEDQAKSFIENLNFSYGEAKRLAKLRKAGPKRRVAEPAGSSAQAAAAFS